MADESKRQRKSAEDPGTLDQQLPDHSHVPGVSRSHTRDGRWFVEKLDIAPEGEARFALLQPEQVVAVRPRLIDHGFTSVAEIKLPERDAPDYKAKRLVLLRLLHICCRRPKGRASLLFPGGDGLQRLSSIDDGRLVQLARKFVAFSEFFADPEPASPK